jgi:spermidine/putrescine transport system ATP-binding protein
MVTLGHAQPEDANKVQAKLISEEFVGSVVTLFLESADGQEFKVQMQERDLLNLDLVPDTEVWLSWSPDNAHMLEGG